MRSPRGKGTWILRKLNAGFAACIIVRALNIYFALCALWSRLQLVGVVVKGSSFLHENSTG
jgi:hypothetical protein